ncbi:MAG: hypothetical protein LBR37_01835, partial [Erysipelotrichaceae bacterium]|nr:hypothetical protein [Erysipelotrichaceae bacterium]
MPSIFGLGETASLLLVIGIVSGIFAIVLLILTLVLVRGNKKKTTSLINNANRLHQIFVTLKRQKIARLEEISNINLLMIDTFNNVNNTYQELKKQYDIPMLSHVGQLKQLMDQKRKNDIHDTYYQLKDIYQEFETKVNNLDAELNLIFAPLETMQTEAMNVKNQTKLLKDDFLEQKDKLLQVEDIFVKSFALVETLFTRFDTLVDMGEFSEAKDLLLKIRNILAELRTSLDFLPQVLFEIEHNIPRKTSKIRMLRTLFLDKNIPLYHLNLDEVLNETAELLESMVVLLKQFKFEGIEAQIQNINTSLDELEAKILKEETEQQVFFSKKNVIIIESEALHKNLMDLGREIDKYKSYFLLEPAKFKDAV